MSPEELFRKLESTLALTRRCWSVKNWFTHPWPASVHAVDDDAAWYHLVGLIAGEIFRQREVAYDDRENDAGWARRYVKKYGEDPYVDR